MESPTDEEYYQPPNKKIEWKETYPKAMGMMQKMGFTKDTGLGKSGQGRLEPIIAVPKNCRRGLGATIDAPTTVQLIDEQWNPDCEKLEIPETVVWLTNEDSTCCDYTTEQLIAMIVYGARKQTLDEESQFCDPYVLYQILNAKAVFDNIPKDKLRRARSRCNPFELISKSIFLNRAAVKMANMDSMCGFLFTNPKDEHGNLLVQSDELLYFADICAGPGGFSEYVLYRKSWQAKGFGFTLRGENDFQLEKFIAASPDSFDAFYGIHNDGNIFDELNQDSLNEYIRKHTPEGVHFVMADGGFSVEGQENIQEILSKQLYLCQFNTALKILRENGSFVCKLFDIFTPFSVGLIYLMYKCFRHISIIKPNSSRPANSERYLVCKYKHADTTQISGYMTAINKILNEESQNAATQRDVLELFDYKQLYEDKQFLSYITNSNNKLGKQQIVSLHKIAAFAQDWSLKETRRRELRQQCLELWQLPELLEDTDATQTTESCLKQLLKDWYEMPAWPSFAAGELKHVAMLNCIKNVKDWYFTPIGRGECSKNACSLFLCKTRGKLLRQTEHKAWELVEQVFNVQPRTLLYGELVSEHAGEGSKQIQYTVLHIIDAIVLGGLDIRRLTLLKRNRMCQLYSLSLNKPYKQIAAASCNIRCKPLIPLSELHNFFGQMQPYRLKNNTQRLGYAFEQNQYFVPGGMLLLCELTQHWGSAHSRSRHLPYYFNTKTHESYFISDLTNELMSRIFGSFRACYVHRMIWKWTNIKQVEEHATADANALEQKLYRRDFVHFIANNLSSH